MRRAAKFIGGLIEVLGGRIWEWGARPEIKRVMKFYENGLGNTGQPW